MSNQNVYLSTGRVPRESGFVLLSKAMEDE